MIGALLGAFQTSKVKLIMIAAMACGIWYAYYQLTTTHFKAGVDSQKAIYEQALKEQAIAHKLAIGEALKKSIKDQKGAEADRAKDAKTANSEIERLNILLGKQPETITIVETKYKCDRLGSEFVRLFNLATFAE